jgi:hypothetical protein
MHVIQVSNEESTPSPITTPWLATLEVVVYVHVPSIDGFKAKVPRDSRDGLFIAYLNDVHGSL